MAKFGINDILNTAKPTPDSSPGSDFREIWLDPYKVKPSDSNFYSLDNIEELADSILTSGQQQPIVLGLVNGEYRIVSGHRRNLANIMNIERGYVKHRKIRYLYKEMTEASFELSLLVGNAYNRELTAWEKTQQAQKLKDALQRAKKEDGLEIIGKLRDLVAGLMNESGTNIARMDTINKNAVPEIKEGLKKGTIGISAAYEASRLPSETQKIIAAKADENGITAKEITNMKQKRTAPKTSHMEEKTSAKPDHSELSDPKSNHSNGILADHLHNTSIEPTSRVSKSDTLKSSMAAAEQTISILENLMHYADRITKDDLDILRGILLHCQNPRTQI